MKAVVMCGGVGSRLKPVTENIPKPLVKILNRPVLDIVIEKLITAGIKEIYLSLGYMANEIIEYCESRRYDAEIVFCEEAVPLGTAGGVKNCIDSTEDDILIVSGDNIFDFDIGKIYDFHFASDADITVCATVVEDPREYGVILTDDDGSVSSFIEKPTWEHARSFLVNTGIYILKGSVLEIIPRNSFFDFSDDLFPDVFRRGLRFMCCSCEGYWGDMGEFRAMTDVTRDILDGRFNGFRFEGNLYNEDVVSENGAVISAPCIVGNNVKIGAQSVIGPYTVIGDNTVVGKNTTVEGSIIGSSSVVGDNCDLKNIISSDNVKINDNCFIDERSVLAYGCVIGRFSRILSGCRIWPGRRIAPESVISRDMFYETPEKIDFDVYGLSGKINTGISLSDAVKLGQSFASVRRIEKIGVGYDSTERACVYKDTVAAGIRACGGLVYDFGEMAKIQAYFYSVYCSLDAFIYVSANGEIISFTFYGKYGMPFPMNEVRQINNNYRFSSFSFCETDGYKEIFNMSLFPTVYKSFFFKTCGEINIPFDIVIETENKILTEILNEVRSRNKSRSKNSLLQVLVNSNGSDIYLVENEKFYSSERILILLCEIEFAGGNDVLLPEDAPSVIEEKAMLYNRNALRAFDSEKRIADIKNEDILKNLWCFDPVIMCAKLFNIMSSMNLTLEKLFEFQDDFSLRKTIVEFDCDASGIRSMITRSGAVRRDNDTYFIISDRKGKARVRQLGNSNRVRILAEARDMETAKELSVAVAEKIRNTDIDKGEQK